MGQLGLACFIILHHNPIIRPLAAYSPLGCMKPQPQASTSFESLMEGRLRMSTDQGVQTRYLGKQSFLGFEPVTRVNCSDGSGISSQRSQITEDLPGKDSYQRRQSVGRSGRVKSQSAVQ